MDLHRLAEERSLALHRVVAERVAADPRLLERARERVRTWLTDGPVDARYAGEWLRILSLPPGELEAAVLDPGERGRALRQVTPFSFVVCPRQRWKIWREVRDLASQAEGGGR